MLFLIFCISWHSRHVTPVFHGNRLPFVEIKLYIHVFFVYGVGLWRRPQTKKLLKEIMPWYYRLCLSQVCRCHWRGSYWYRGFCADLPWWCWGGSLRAARLYRVGGVDVFVRFCRVRIGVFGRARIHTDRFVCVNVFVIYGWIVLSSYTTWIYFMKMCMIHIYIYIYMCVCVCVCVYMCVCVCVCVCVNISI